MKTSYTLEQVVLSKIAGLFDASLDEFTFYTTLPGLPDSADDFAHFLDSIPKGEMFFKSGETINYFSQVYGKILKAQKKQPLAIEIGLKNFKDKNNWLSPYTIPKNTPTLESAKSHIGDAGKAETTVKSSQQPVIVPTVPEFPNIVYSASLLDFFQKVAQSEFTTTVTFDKACSIPVGLGGWFSTGAFLYAYQTPDNWDTSVISWDEVFGSASGILKYINTSVVLVSDMTIELLVSGSFDTSTVKMLQAIPDQIIFPFYQQISGSELSFALEEDKSIKITLKVPQKSDYIFGIQYQSIKHYIS